MFERAPREANAMRFQDRLAGWIDDRPVVQWIEVRMPRLAIALLLGLLGALLAFALIRILDWTPVSTLG